jgi:hypothetical protein
MSALRKSEEDLVRLRSDDDFETYRYALSGHGPQHETIIEVDPDDDLTSVRSKLESSRLPRAVIVIPPNSKTLRDGIEFRVLRRLQRELGLDMVIVSTDMNRRGLAHENGFHHVFNTLKGYYRSKDSGVTSIDGTPFTNPEEFSPSIGIGRWGVVIAGILSAVLAIAGYLAIPVASVTVYPESQSLTRDVQVLVETGGPNIDLTAQRLSGRVLQQQVQVQGSINVADVPAPPAAPDGSQAPQQPATITLQVRDALHAKLMKQATDQINQQLKAALKSNESMPQQGIQMQVTGERYDHGLGDNATELSGYLEVTATGLAFNNDDFNKLAYALWSQDIPKNFGAVGDPTLSPPAVVSAEGQQMTLRTRASGKLQRDIDATAIVNAVRWQTPQEARQAIDALGSFAQPAQVDVWPGWASRAFRIQIDAALGSAVASQQPTSSSSTP